MVVGKRFQDPLQTIIDLAGNILGPASTPELMQFRDKTIKYFQMVATMKKRHNTIRKIKDEHENWCEDQNDIAGHYL